MNALMLTLAGICVGLAGGLFGIGGSIVLIPVLSEFLGPDQHRYQAAAMTINFFVAVPAMFQHFRARAVDFVLLAWVAPAAIVGVLAGVLVSELPAFRGDGEAWLRIFFAVFLVFAAAADLYRMLFPASAGGPMGVEGSGGDVPPLDVMDQPDSFSAGGAGLTGPGTARLPGTGDRPIQGRADTSRLRALAVGLPTGIISGLLGVGGGVVAVPLQRRILGMPIRQAIANSAALIIATSIFGAISKNYAYFHEMGGSSDALTLAALVAPGAVAGSLVGSRLTHKLRLGTLRALFILLLVVAAARMAWAAIHELA
jgi:hypothetical protein